MPFGGNRPFKKDLAPINIHRPGQVVKHEGKGARSGAPPVPAMGSNYGKPAPAPAVAAKPVGGLGDGSFPGVGI